MLIREPDTRSPAFLLTVAALGVAIEALVLLSAQAADKLDLLEGVVGRGLLFLLGLSLVYLGAQVLRARFAVPIVAGMSLCLLGAMLGWLAVFAGLMFFLAALGTLLFSFLWLPLAAVLRRAWRRPPWRAAELAAASRKPVIG